MLKIPKSVIFIVIAVLLLFFSPLAIYKATYLIQTNGNISPNKNNEHRGITNNFTHNGTAYNGNFEIGSSPLAKLDSSIIIKKYRHLNFGLYSQIRIEAEFKAIRQGSSINFTSNAEFMIFGLASISHKRRFAESIIMKEIEKARQDNQDRYKRKSTSIKPPQTADKDWGMLKN